MYIYWFIEFIRQGTGDSYLCVELMIRLHFVEFSGRWWKNTFLVDPDTLVDQ